LKFQYKLSFHVRNIFVARKKNNSGSSISPMHSASYTRMSVVSTKKTFSSTVKCPRSK